MNGEHAFFLMFGAMLGIGVSLMVMHVFHMIVVAQ